MFCFSIPAISRVPSVSSVQAAKLSRLVSRSGVKLGLQRAGREGAASHYTQQLAKTSSQRSKLSIIMKDKLLQSYNQ